MNGRVLVIGVVLADRPNHGETLCQTFNASQQWTVMQEWARMVAPYEPRQPALNAILQRHDWQTYDFVICCDDDVVLPVGFLDAFLAVQRLYQFDLAQPARMGPVDHRVTARRSGSRARRTNFVEIGPLTSFGPRAFALLPFDESSPMGWGLDAVWAAQAEAAGWRLGIVDDTPILHGLRKIGQTYDRAQARTDRDAYLQTRSFVPPAQYRTLEVYS